MFKSINQIMRLPCWESSKAFHLIWNKMQTPHPAVQGPVWPALCLTRWNILISILKRILLNGYTLLSWKFFLSIIFCTTTHDEEIYICMVNIFWRFNWKITPFFSSDNYLILMFAPVPHNCKAHSYKITAWFQGTKPKIHSTMHTLYLKCLLE